MKEIFDKRRLIAKQAGTALALCAAVFIFGCAREKAPEKRVEPITERMKHGPVEIEMIMEPPEIRLDRDTLLTIKVTTPEKVNVHPPSVADRLTGFEFKSSFKRPRTEKENDEIVREYCFRLTPKIAEEYRIGPMAVTFIDDRESQEKEKWFATQPVTLKRKETPERSGEDAVIKGIRSPVWIAPSFKTIVLWVLGGLLIVITAAALVLLSRKIHKTIKLRSMSPRERALYDLRQLLAKDLIKKKQIKKFYLELTMIVRRYIERAHGIRAPEQTTEEFLAASSKSAQFNPEVLEKLRRFLKQADLVKFAAYRPDQKKIDLAMSTARDYIKTDERATEEQEK